MKHNTCHLSFFYQYSLRSVADLEENAFFVTLQNLNFIGEHLFATLNTAEGNARALSTFQSRSGYIHLVASQCRTRHIVGNVSSSDDHDLAANNMQLVQGDAPQILHTSNNTLCVRARQRQGKRISQAACNNHGIMSFSQA